MLTIVLSLASPSTNLAYTTDDAIRLSASIQVYIVNIIIAFYQLDLFTWYPSNAW